MRSPVTYIASVMLALGLSACTENEAPRRLTGNPDARYEPTPSTSERVVAGVSYTDVTSSAGIDFEHVSGAYGRKLLPETMGGGVGVFDYDNDGKLDILFVQSRYWEGHVPAGASQPTLKLYKNLGNWKFQDVTEEAGLAVSVYGMGCAIADYDADGDMDIYVTCLGRNRLFRNREGKRFEEVEGAPDGGTWKDEKGVEHPSWSTGAVWFDADQDDDLDLLVVSYVRWTKETDVEATVTGGEKAYTRPQLYPGDWPRLYLQQQDGSFRDASSESGFSGSGDPGKSMSICLDDYNDDGKIDVFVANDTVQNFLYMNRGGGRFTETAITAAIAYDDRGQARAGMGTDSVDWRNDGRVAITIGNFSEEPVSVYTVQHARGGTPVFRDDASRARIGHATLLPLTFGLLAIDADLDGWCDLVLANGHIEPSVTKVKPEVIYAQTPQLFKNVKGRRYQEVSMDIGAAFQQPMVGRGLAAGDFDNDGDLDLVFTQNGARAEHGRPALLRCESDGTNRSLRIRLHQYGRNPDALDAIVRVTTGGITQRRVVRTGGSYLSQSELTLTFGLGANAKADEVVISWPGGKKQVLRDVPAGSRTIRME